MTKLQQAVRELLDRQSVSRARLSEIAILADSDMTDDIRAEAVRLHSETPDIELRLRSAREALEAEQEATEEKPIDGEDREKMRLRSTSRIGSYLTAAARGGIVAGAEAEYNAALGIPESGFPLELLAPVETEDDIRRRASTDTDGRVTTTTWIDRVFPDDMAARYLGVTFKSVAPGVARVPVTTAGAAAAQRGRGEDTADAAWTVGTTDIDPTRAAVRAVFNREDQLRNPGLEDALRRDLRMALMEGVDRSVFLGDAGANEDTADIVGFTTLAGIGEQTITQAAKVKADKTLAAFVDLIDGRYAQGLEDLGVVASVGAGTLWLKTIHSTQTTNQTISQFLRESGLSWRMRGELETDTANGDFGAFVGLKRGIADAACAAIWNSGELIRDQYSGAKSGEVSITLSYYWGFKVPRVANFKRVKFVT